MKKTTTLERIKKDIREHLGKPLFLKKPKPIKRRRGRPIKNGRKKIYIVHNGFKVTKKRPSKKTIKEKEVYYFQKRLPKYKK